ncbi:MAG: adhesin, partial [Nitrospirae bacterium]|nr:adhesin [Nitrospirota bacterium]
TNSTGNETGVTVNGMVAAVYNGQFVVNHVPLIDGSNTITATATDTAGKTAATSITVNAITTGNYINLTANIESGIAPLTTYFSVSTSIPNAVSTYQMDYEGDGTIDYTGTVFDNISFTYSTEGIYYPTVIVTDDQGIQYSDTIAIVVLNATELDALLRAKWEAMKTALANQDVNTAMIEISENAQEIFRYNFELMQSILPTIVQGIGSITLIRAEDGIVEYEMISGGQSYYIEFVKDTNGIWRINFF